MNAETILCPECGWTGQKTDLEVGDQGGHYCPICDEDIEFVD